MANPEYIPDVSHVEEVAEKLYTKYCSEVGGKAFNGDPLPSWREFRDDPNKRKQSDAWMATARLAFDIV